jgi:hypothetical protein
MTPHPEVFSNDIVERLNRVGLALGNAIAGYRDADFKRSARGMVEIARMTQQAADEIKYLRAALKLKP